MKIAVSFAADIRPMFRVIDVDHMKPFDVFLDDYTYMSDPADDHVNARTTYGYLTGESQPRMPIGGPFWTTEQLNLFAQWMSDGYQA